MPRAAWLQSTFIGGEWSKQAQGRMHDPRYKAALALARNTIVLEENSAVRRPGTRLCAVTRGGAEARLVPYVFDPEYPYVLEFTDGHLRAFQGPRLATEAPVSISSISTASPAVLSLASPAEWVDDDQVRFIYGDAEASSALARLGRRPFAVKMLTTSTFALYDGITGVAFDGSTISWASGLDVSVAKVIDVETPYTNEEWRRAVVVPTDDEAVVLTGSEPQTLTPSGEADAREFTLDPTAFVDGPYLDPVDGSYATPDELDGIINLTLTFQAWTATKAYALGDFVTHSSLWWRSTAAENVNNTPSISSAYWEAASPGDVVGEDGFTEADIGRMVRLHSEPPDWATATSYTTGNVVKFNDLYWTALTNMTGATPAAGDINPNQPGNLATTWEVNTTGHRWTWGKIVGLSSTGSIDPGSGTNIGNMTGSGGLAAAFDSNTSQTFAQCATGTGGGGDDYVGKNFSPATTISGARVHPSSDFGFVDDGGGSFNSSLTFTMNLRAKHTAPANSADGTLLATTGVINNTLDAITLVSSDPSTTWEYVWVELVYSIYTMVGELELSTAAAAAGSAVEVQLLGGALLYTSTIREWRLGLYGRDVWPTCGAYHEGRIYLSGAVKNRFDASMSNLPFVFSPTSDLGSVSDNNAFSYTLNSKEKQDVRWLASTDQGVLLGTSGGAWLIHASNQNNRITPTSIQAHRVTGHKTADTEPVEVGACTIFVEKQGRKVMEFMPDGQAGRYFGNNLSEFAKHFTEGGVTELAYTEEKTPVVWGLTGLGALIGCTYKRVNLLSTQPPEINAWHKHELGSGRAIENICAGTSEDGVSALMMVTKDPNSNTRWVEMLGDLQEEEEEVYTSRYLDNEVVPVAAESYASGIRLLGLDMLNTKSVTVFVGGIDCGTFVVSNGAVEVPYSGLFTERAMTQVSASAEDFGNVAVAVDAGDLFTIPVVVGSKQTSQGQVLRGIAPADTGAANGPALGKTRRQETFNALLHNTREISFGTSFAKLRPASFRSDGQVALADTELFSGVYQGKVDDGYSYDSQLCWEAGGCFPANILALGGFISTQDQ